MKFLALTLITVGLLVFETHAQETKLIVTSKTDEDRQHEKNKVHIGYTVDFVEEYYVLKSDENVRHGTYVKYRKAFGGPQLLTSGAYTNGQQSGLWQYYYDVANKKFRNSIESTGQYINGKRNGLWKFFYLDTIPDVVHEDVVMAKKKIEAINVAIDHRAEKLRLAGRYLNDKRIGEWTAVLPSGKMSQRYDFTKQSLIFEHSITDTTTYNVNTRALYIGGKSSLLNVLHRSYYFSADLVKKLRGDSAFVTVSFIIDKNGKALTPKLVDSYCTKALENEALRVVSVRATEWIPAVVNSESVDSAYKIQVVVKAKDGVSKFTMYEVLFRPLDE